jgi:very-short-patch-repair endonuclease
LSGGEFLFRKLGASAWELVDMFEMLFQYWQLWLVLAMVVGFFWLMRTFSNRRRLPYTVKERLVTKAELRFYRALQKAAGKDFEIFAMVRIADILAVPQDHSQRSKWLGKILAKHVDFVLCETTNLAPQIAIELDGSSHDRPDRRERDEFVDHAFESAGLPLLRIKNSSSYDSAALRELIDEHLGVE